MKLPLRRYPTLLTFSQGQPVAHPLPRIQKVRHKRKNQLPPLKAQPAIAAHAAWTASEDERLANLIRETNKNWDTIAAHLPGRTTDEVARRALEINGKRLARWEKEEDSVLIDAYRKYGNNWETIAKLLPGRSPLAVRKHFHGKIRDRYGFGEGGGAGGVGGGKEGGDGGGGGGSE